MSSFVPPIEACRSTEAFTLFFKPLVLTIQSANTHGHKKRIKDEAMHSRAGNMPLTVWEKVSCGYLLPVSLISLDISFTLAPFTSFPVNFDRNKVQ